MASRSAKGQGFPDGAPTPEQLISILEEFQRQGGNMDEVPSDLQALLRNVKKEKGQPTDDTPTEEITPEPGFVVKTQDEHGRKVFINMCGHAKVAAPGNWTAGKLPEEVANALDNVENLSVEQAEALRFPLSMGSPRLDADKKGQPCTTIDCCLNLDVLKQASVFRPLKAFLIELAINWINHKHKLQLDPKFKLPKMKYKGEEVEPQRIRVDRKPLVTEVRELPEDPAFPLVTKKVQPKPEQQQQPQQQAASTLGAPAPSASASAGSKAAAASAPASAQQGSSKGSSAAAPHAAASSQHQTAQPQLKVESKEYNGRPVESVTLHITLPSSVSSKAASQPAALAEQLRVEVCGEAVFVGLPACAELQVPLPFAVSPQGAIAEVDATGCKLSLRLPYQPLSELLKETRHEAPFKFGQMGAVSDSFLELEP